jgi:hypothetical protein
MDALLNKSTVIWLGLAGAALLLYYTSTEFSQHYEQRAEKLAEQDPGFGGSRRLNIDVKNKVLTYTDKAKIELKDCKNGFCGSLFASRENPLSGEPESIAVTTFCDTENPPKQRSSALALFRESCFNNLDPCPKGTLRLKIVTEDYQGSNEVVAPTASKGQPLGAALCIKDPSTQRVYPSKAEKQRFTGNIAVYSIYRSHLDGNIKLGAEYFALPWPKTKLKPAH